MTSKSATTASTTTIVGLLFFVLAGAGVVGDGAAGWTGAGELAGSGEVCGAGSGWAVGGGVSLLGVESDTAAGSGD